MASEIPWIKIMTDIFEDPKIQLIQDLPDGESFVLLWIKMLCLAGKTNEGGFIFFDKSNAYTLSELAVLLKAKHQTLEFALRIFQRYNMVEVFDNNFIFITHWEKHQNVESMDKIREQTKKRVAAHREKKKQALLLGGNVTSNATSNATSNVTETLLLNGNVTSNVTGNVSVTHRNATDIERDLDLEKEKISISISEPENLAIIPKLNILEALNKYQVVQDGGVVHLEYIESYLGVMEDALILDAIKRSSKETYSYCRKILSNWNKKGYRRYLDVPQNQIDQAVNEYAAAGVDKPGRSAKGNSANKSDEAGNVRDVTNGQTGRIIYAERD